MLSQPVTTAAACFEVTGAAVAGCQEALSNIARAMHASTVPSLETLSGGLVFIGGLVFVVIGLIGDR
jgi:UPF0716 family protein affecting phage T7 exclusion